MEGSRPLAFLAARVRRGPEATSPGTDVFWIAGASEDVEGATGAVRTAAERPGRVAFEVDASRATALVMLDGFFPGWHATVNGQAAEVLPVGRHRGVWVPQGHSAVTLAYRPPGLRPGLALCGAAVILMAGLWWRERLRPAGAGAPDVPGAASIAARRTG